MKQGTRTFLKLLPLGLQGFVLIGALGVVMMFMVPIAAQIIEEAEGKIQMPAPSLLLVEHAGVAKFLLVAIYAVSLCTYSFTRKFIKNEAEQVIIQNAVYGAVWYVGIVFLSAMAMAAILPYFVLYGPIQ